MFMYMDVDVVKVGIIYIIMYEKRYYFYSLVKSHHGKNYLYIFLALTIFRQEYGFSS